MKPKPRKVMAHNNGYDDDGSPLRRSHRLQQRHSDIHWFINKDGLEEKQLLAKNGLQQSWSQPSWGGKRRRVFLKGVSSILNNAHIYGFSKGWNRMVRLLNLHHHSISVKLPENEDPQLPSSSISCTGAHFVKKIKRKKLRPKVTRDAQPLRKRNMGRSGSYKSNPSQKNSGRSSYAASRAKFSSQFNGAQILWQISMAFQHQRLRFTRAYSANRHLLSCAKVKSCTSYARHSDREIIAVQDWQLEGPSIQHCLGQHDEVNNGGSNLCLSLLQPGYYAGETELWENKHLEMVPCKINGEIILPNSSKRTRKKPKTKVKLDEETIRVWLLLENGSTLPEEEDEVKAKMWEEMRFTMKARVESFLGLMRKIQGNRQFSHWTGSVLDSVIGALLTQNTSDHLSSSAFMSLAARYAPNRGNTLHMGVEAQTAHYCENISSKFYPQIAHSRNLLDKTEIDFCLDLSQQDDVRIDGCFLTEQESIHEITSGLLTGEKKRAYSISAISGIKRARLEASYSGRKKTERNWESLRRTVVGLNNPLRDQHSVPHQRHEGKDIVDWEAVRLAEVGKVADAIKERGMHNTLAGRIQALLKTLHKEQGNLDLEWIRRIPTEDACEYLRDVRGLGIKSVECIRLLTLHHVAFPVDTNVARVCVRLGWVPIEPLPEQFPLHNLEMYPIEESVQKYLWPRLCKLDYLTLYELHYQMITFGKVFCTKIRPNCESCPLQKECKHFASAHPRQKPLPSSLDVHDMRSLVDVQAFPATESSILRIENLYNESQQIEAEVHQIIESGTPIIEEPATPEHEILDIEDILRYKNIESEDTYLHEVSPTARSEDVSFHLLDDLNTELDTGIMLRMNLTPYKHSFENYTSECQSEITTTGINATRYFPIRNRCLFEDTPSDSQMFTSASVVNSIIPYPLKSAYSSNPKIKNAGRLQTIHYVYVVPDGHELLKEMDTRVERDPCHYLLAIWNPAKVPRSSKKKCSYQERTWMEAHKDSLPYIDCVKGTLLIPCRTALRGAFPLNGTYFQVNEVFADYASSVKPLNIPRSWIWNWRRCFVYFGTSIQHIFRGLSIQEIHACFFLGHVCVRSFDHKTREPKPLLEWLHFPISKQAKGSETNRI